MTVSTDGHIPTVPGLSELNLDPVFLRGDTQLEELSSSNGCSSLGKVLATDTGLMLPK